MLQFIYCDADAGILDFNAQAAVHRVGFEADAPVVGEFGGIADQVDQDLLDFFLIGGQRRQIGR